MKYLGLFKVSYLFVLLLFLGSIYGCHRYKIKEDYYEKGKTSLSTKQFNKNFFVLHVGDNMYEIKNIKFTQQKITGSLREFGGKEKMYYEQYKLSGSTKVAKKDKSYVDQLHIFASKYSGDSTDAIIEGVDINLVETMKYKSGAAIVTPLIIIGVLVLAIAGLAIACNCPHVYVDDGEGYYYNNTLFTGANYPALERNDYKLMPDYYSENTDYNVVIKNEDKEEQYTNLLELIVVEHDKDEQVVTDQNGVIYSIVNELKPIKSIGDNEEDLSSFITYNDDLPYSFNIKSKEVFSNVYLTFDTPDQNDAKLIIKSKNTQWSGAVYNEFNSMLGKHYSKWQEKNLKKSAEELNYMRKEGGIPLVVSIKSGSQWVDIESIDPIGEVNYNTIVVPIDDKFITPGEELEVRVRSGFMFWDLDYVAIDFTAKKELNIQYLKPSLAKGQNDINFVSALSLDDDLYMESMQLGDSTYVKFQGLSASSTSDRTIFLHSKGYYLSKLEYEGKADRRELVQFKELGGMSIFSRNLFEQYSSMFALEE